VIHSVYIRGIAIGVCETYSTHRGGEICKQNSLKERRHPHKKRKKNSSLWLESASKLYQRSDRSLSAKLALTFVDRGCHMVSVTDPYSHILNFIDRCHPHVGVNIKTKEILERQSMKL
jgi:hypothetical protein